MNIETSSANNQLLSKNNMEIVKKMIVNHEDLHAAVRLAAFENNIELVLLLIKKGASRECAALGAGEGNCDQLIQELAKNDKNIKDIAIEGAALANRMDLVQKLLNEGASRNFAARGAGAGNCLELLKLLVNDDTSRCFAVWGAALANHIPLVWTLINEGASKDDALWGATAGNHLDLVKDLLAEGACAYRGAQGAMAGGHVDLLNRLITDQKSREYAVCGAVEGGIFGETEEKILRYIVSIHDLELRKLLINKAAQENKKINIQSFSTKVAKLSRVMKDYQLNIDQAEAWLMPELYIWFLQAIPTVDETYNNFPREMHLQMVSFLTGLSDRDTINLWEKFFSILPEKLFDVSKKANEQKLNSSKKSCHLFTLFSAKKPDITKEKMAEKDYLKEQQLALDRYHRRKRNH